MEKENGTLKSGEEKEEEEHFDMEGEEGLENKRSLTDKQFSLLGKNKYYRAVLLYPLMIYYLYGQEIHLQQD